jgi:hypothetical protein
MNGFNYSIKSRHQGKGGRWAGYYRCIHWQKTTGTGPCPAALTMKYKPEQSCELPVGYMVPTYIQTISETAKHSCSVEVTVTGIKDVLQESKLL